MTRYVITRLLGAFAVLVVVSVVVFSLLHLAPGDPAVIIAGADADQATVNRIRADLGLDQSLTAQYLDWVRQLCTGDLGTSYTLGQPISSLIAQRLPGTLQLTVAATLVMTVFGLLTGVVLATTRSRVLRWVIDQLSTLSLALPPFVSGVVLIFFFAVLWRVLPSGGDASLVDTPASSIRRLILPAIAMALPAIPVVARLLATEIRRNLDQEYVLTALAKGAARRRITWRHVLPNSLGPAVLELAIRIGHLLGGAVVAEAIFARAGLGSLLVQAVQTRDYRLAQVLLLLAIGAAIVIQLLSELLIARMDPRIRLGGKA
ncbi:ABC transporter permease [Dactylosporangium sp. AC04546]|uniref:ABC transporter permease n=1 Tax=Dactylosporangium sp. AC04546 TaxID=2862460 RepID=UPI001EDCB6DD|nr:ABC transporter permease [Dactylosporangium sp. AC04546]WVK88970.1 ABC transporter permease [Dactylosporangium sp. AC04546]